MFILFYFCLNLLCDTKTISSVALIDSKWWGSFDSAPMEPVGIDGLNLMNERMKVYLYLSYLYNISNILNNILNNSGRICCNRHEVKPTLVFESVKKSLTRVGFEPMTFGLLDRRSTSWATESTGRGVWITNLIMCEHI